MKIIVHTFLAEDGVSPGSIGPILHGIENLGYSIMAIKNNEALVKVNIKDENILIGKENKFKKLLKDTDLNYKEEAEKIGVKLNIQYKIADFEVH